MNLCLAGLVAAVRCTSLLGMAMLRSTFVTTRRALHAAARARRHGAQARAGLPRAAGHRRRERQPPGGAQPCVLSLRQVRVILVSCLSRHAFGSTLIALTGAHHLMICARMPCIIMGNSLLKSSCTGTSGCRCCGLSTASAGGCGQVDATAKWATDACCARAHQHVWQEVLRCVSRWELLRADRRGRRRPTRTSSPRPPSRRTAAKRRPFFSMRRDAGADAGTCAALLHVDSMECACNIRRVLPSH